MKYTVNNGVLTIQPPERLTADKYVAIRSGMLEIIEANPFDSLVIDLLNTIVVSSSGLRIIIELMKTYKNVSVINASLDVYDVFELTGLTELVPVTKALKQVSVDGCPLLGHGNNGNVYRYNEDTIIKVYTRDTVKLEDIEREHLLARKAFVLGVPTALTLDTVIVGQHYGAMYEMIGADSVLGLVYKHPENFDKYIRKFNEGMKLINAIHTDRDPILTDKKAEYLRWTRDTEHLFTPEQYAEVLKFVESIPDEDYLVHGDYHLANVMVQDDELLLIDMDTLGYGCPIIEMANLFFTLIGIKIAMGEDHFYDMDDQDKIRCWNLVCDDIYQDLSPEEKGRNIAFAEALALVRALRMGYRRHTTEERLELVRREIFSRINSL